MYNGVTFTKAEDLDALCNNAYRILAEIGVLVESPQMVDFLLNAGHKGLKLDNGRIKVEKELAKSFFFEAADKETRPRVPEASASAEIYEGWYLDPEDGVYKPWSERRLLDYIKLAKKLEHVNNACMLGCPVPEYESYKKPLYEKLYTAKYGLSTRMGGYSIWDTSLCPALYEMWAVIAQEKNLPIEQVFQGGVYMISPLKLGRVECEHLLWFRERSLRCFIGCMSSLGMTAPITLAGAISVQLAELMFASVASMCLYGFPAVHIWRSLSASDLRTMNFRYGRPEQLIMNNAMCDIARRFDMKYWGHDGLTDAKAPSYEAAAQKMATVLAHIMKGERGEICAGVLSVDEIFSPTQMVLDNEITGYLKRICRRFDTDEESLAFEDVLEVVEEGGSFVSSELTMMKMRQELWMPSIFSSSMYSDWKNTARTDADLAREKSIELIRSGDDPESCISDLCEQKLLEIIRRY